MTDASSQLGGYLEEKVPEGLLALEHLHKRRDNIHSIHSASILGGRGRDAALPRPASFFSEVFR
jgi:hypothetical protein